jgi:hypothetical protein
MPEMPGLLPEAWTESSYQSLEQLEQVYRAQASGSASQVAPLCPTLTLNADPAIHMAAAKAVNRYTNTARSRSLPNCVFRRH